MATLGKNQVFEIKNGDGTSFHNLVLRKSAVESVVMSLGDKISGDVYYRDNSLSVTMHEYITYNGVNYMLVNPPTIVREGIVSDNSELKGMTKYSFVFYHPMCQLANFPFSDVAVTSDETRYLSEGTTFSWIGKPADFVAKLNKNLAGTEWIVELSSRFPQDKLDELSGVIPFDKATIADACKTFYDTWGVPYVVDKVDQTEASYANGKRFKIVMGLPSNEIYSSAQAEQQGTPFVFQMGHGVGLKNNSRTPRNNKIITRISGYGSENNIPYGYPQVRWYGTAGQSFTYGDHAGVYTDVTIDGVHLDKVISYPIYKGILDGEYVELIKHPFTRTHLMPSVYRTCLFNKISFLDDNGEFNTDYDPDITLIDYYDAVYSSQYPYPNTINLQAPSYESHEFVDEKPELGEAHIISATPLNNDLTTASSWDDSLDDDGNYKQSYFQMVLPQLSFDLYACASITEEMQINMRSGTCLGCTFTVQVDWDDYKRNFYDEEGNFAPNGSQRDLTKYPKSNQGSISLVLQKDNSTFGTLMPNMYQYPKGETSSGAGDGDTFAILGISLPESYIFAAEWRLDADMKSYMLENNVHYFDYPLKFDEDFLFHNENILSQIRPNTVVRFNYAGQTQALFVKQITVKYGDQPLPQYDITLTDNVEVVLNKIGQVAEDVEKLSTLIAILRQSYGKNVLSELAKKLSKTQDDTAAGYITMLKGLQIGANFVPDILGEGGVLRMRDDGKVELVTDILYARVKAYFDSVEIREYQHTGGNRIASVAGNKICRVAWFNSSNVELEQTQANLASVAYFRCYFRASDGEDTVRNNWVIGDQAYCHITSVTTGSDNPEQKGLNQKHLWRLVIGRNTEGTLTEDGEAYIDLSNRATESISGTSYTGYQSGSDIPEAQDDIIQLGNVNDTTRQGAIVEFVTGTDAPSYQIYQGINSFSLNGKNQITIGYNTATGKADMKVYGDAYIGARDRSTFIEYKQSGTGGNPELNIKAHVEFTNSQQELDNFVQAHQRDDSYDDTEVRGLIDGLQDQIDGQIESWFYNYAPVAVDSQGAPTSNVPSNVEPYKSWNDADVAAGNDAQKIAHLGDTFTNNKTGYCWRFTRNSSTNAFEWTIIQDSAVITALQNAARAQDTADHKRRVFLTQPTPPYDAGDMWVNAVYPANYTGVTDEANHNYNNDILKCVTAKASDGSFSINDWALASKYTDDSKFNGYISALLNNTGLSGDSAAAAVQNAILGALGVGTVVAGGLLLTSLIGMRQYNGSGDKSDVSNYTTWAGISGQYNANVLGGGMAAWYGGGMLDKETLSPVQIEQGWNTLRWAKGVDRFDGSGYRADGNISWNANGALTIKNITTLSDSNNNNILNELATFNSAFTFGTSGQGSTTALYITPQVPFESLYIGTSNANKQEVATKNWVNQNFVTTTFFDNLFHLYNGTESAGNKIAVNGTLPTDKTNLNIEAMFGFWTKKFISALGQGDDGSTSYTTLAQLNDVTLTNPTANQVLSYNGTHWVNKSIELGSQTLADLTDVVITSPAANQMLGYDATTQKWKNIAIPATGVTSVALSMPTGFSITGSPITASGTFTVAFASGYSLPTTAKQSNWDTAYGWGDHADAGYALASDLGTASSHAHSDYLTSLSWDSTNKKLAWSKGGTAQTAITIGYASVAGSVAWDNVSSKPTTLSGYGITDAKIANGVITLGANSITPVTTLYTLSIYGGTTKVVSFKPNADASLYIKAGGDISLTNDTTNKYITLSYSHPTNGADTAITAANGKVLSAITVNSLGHVTSVSSKTLAAADIPDISETYATAARATTLEGYFTNGVAKKAAQLNTSHSLWGNSFNGTADINGNIVMNSANGTYIQIGAIRIVYDSANNALKVVKSDGTTAANFYATGGISALGETSDGTAGVGDVTWALLADNTDTRQIARSHLTTALTPYATQDWVAANFNNYSLPLAANGTRGGIQVGYTTSIANHNYAVQLSSEKAYVNIPLFVKSGSTAASGLVPAPSTTAGTTKFLREDGTWVVPDGTFSLSVATSTALGGIKIGYSGTTAKTYAVVLDSSNKAYVSVPWENTWTAWAGATSTANGTAGYMPAPTSAQRNQFLRGDGTWVDLNNYSLPTASASTLGGVKVGTTLAISSGVLNLPTTGVTAGTYKRVTVDAYGRVTSGDNTDIDTNTWRNIYVDGTSEVGTGIDTKAINFKAGSNVAISYVAAGTGSGKSGNANYFDIVISATDTTYSAATQSVAGLMSAADKKKLDGVAEGANNYSLPLAASGTRGGVKIGYSESNSGTSTDRNYAVQLSSEKMFVNVPWVNTWRGIQNNLTSQSTTDSLSAYQGYLLANGSARDNTKLPLTGGTLTGTLTARDVVVQSAYTLKIGDAILKWDSANNALKLYKISGSSEVAVNFYATGGVSALGMSEDGSAGAGDVTWALLASNSDTRQIALSHLTTSLTTITGGTTDSANKKYAVYKNSSNQLFVDVPWQAGAGTVTSVKVGTTSYTPTNGVISLPAYPTVPTKVSQLTNDSGYITSYTNTWRNIYVSGTEKLTTAITTKGLNFAAGSNVSLSFTAAGSGTGQNANYGTIKISATDTTYESKAAASGGTAVSLVTTGEKYTWNSKAAGNHTHTTSIATSTAANQLTLAFGSKYAITAGGTSYVFTMPSNPNTNTTYKFTIGSTTKGDATNGVDLGTLKSETAAASGTTLSLVTTGEKAVWNAKSNLAIGTTATTAAAGNHTHTTSIAADSGTNQLTLAFGTKYKLTAGGTSFVFTMPSNPDTDVNVKVNNTNPTTGTWYYPVWYTATSGTGNVNANDGFRYYSLQGTALALGESYLQIGNATASGTTGNKRGHLRIYGNKAYYGEFNVVDDLTANKTYTFSDEGTVLTSGNSSVSLSGQTLTVKINGVSKSLTNSTYTFTNKGATLSWGSTSTIATVGGVDIKVTMPANPNTDHYDWSDITNKPLTLTKKTTGFSISGGTTSKTLTVGADYTLGAACEKGVTDNSSSTAVSSTDTNLITARTLYYAGYVKSSGVTSVATGTGLTGGTITGTGTISINSTYQTYISHGETAYGWGNHANAGYAAASSLSNYLPLAGGTMTGNLTMGLTGASIRLYTGDYQLGCNETDDFYIWSTNNSARFRIGTNNLERFTVLTNGNVGIGTQSPSYLLDINGISKSVYMLFKNYNNTGDAGYVGRGSTQNNTIFLGGYTGNAIGIGASDSVTDIWINTSHNVGINTQQPSYTLDVNGTARANNYLTSGSNGSYVQIGAIRLVYDSTNNAIKVIKSDGTNASLYATGGLSALGAGQESGGGGGIGMMDYLLFKNVNDSGSAGYVGRGGTSNNTIYLSAYSGNALGIGANDSSRDIWINTSHYVGIGTMSPLELLHVEGTIYNSGYLRSIGFLVTDEVYSHPNLGSLYVRDRSVALMIRGGKYGLFSYVLGNGNVYFQVGRSDGDTSVYDLCMQTSGGNVGIGVATTSYKLHVAGTVGATGFTNTSDIRKKNVIKDVDLRLDQIAKAPAFEYYWLDTSIDHDLHVGTSAQYWESVLPQVVTTAKDEIGTKAMQYGVAALISAITVARKVMTHEEKIALLETRVSALEKENGEQEQLINSLQEELSKFKAA